MTAKSADDNPKWPDKRAAAGPTTGPQLGLEGDRPYDSQGSATYASKLAARKAANQGDSVGDRMWERWNIRQAGDPVECSCSIDRLNRRPFPEAVTIFTMHP